MTFRQELMLAVLMEELAHEIAGPVRFLDAVLRDLDDGLAIEREDVSIALEEMERLRKLLSNLRRIHLPELPTMPLELAALVEEAASAQAELHRRREIAIARDVPSGIFIDVHPSYVEQTLAPLLAVALASAPNGGCVAIVARALDGQIELDFRLPVAARELPRLTLPFSSPAFDLLVARRIATSYGHRLEQEQTGGGALLRLRMPPAAAMGDRDRSQGGDTGCVS
jgi:signal transduction histidine kinase